jgi:hypothetical protein
MDRLSSLVDVMSHLVYTPGLAAEAAQFLSVPTASGLPIRSLDQQ